MNLIWLKNLACCLISMLLFSNGLEAAWSPAVTISQAGLDSRFSMVEGAGNTAVAVWLTFDDFTDTDVLFSSTRSSVGVWSAPVAISPSTRKAYDPVLVVDSNNGAVVVWLSHDPITTREILAARLPFAGVWTIPTVIYSAPITEKVQFNSIEATTNTIGETIVTWTIHDGTNFLIKSSAFTPP